SQTTWAAALARGKAIADGRVHGAAPGPYRALELIELARTASRDKGFTAEDEALADLIMTDEMRAGLYSFNLVQKRARKPAGAPDTSLARPVTKVGIVGAGLMASQLALLFARQLEVPVVLTDLDQARLDKGVGFVHGEIDKLLARARLNHDTANRLKALLEVIRGGRTDDASLATAFAVARKLHKTAGLVRDAPAFVVNRLLARFLGEVNKSIDEGTAFEVADSALEPVGLPMSPLVLLQ